MRRMKVLNTRPEGFSIELSKLLKEFGLESLDFPVTRLRSLFHDEIVTEVERKAEAGDWFIFTSRSGVAFLHAALVERFGETRAQSVFQRVSIAAIGEQTANAIRSIGAEVSFIPSSASSRVFESEFIPFAESMSGSFFLFRAERASLVIRDSLLRRRKKVLDVVAYEMSEVPAAELPLGELASDLRDNRLSAIVFASSDGVRVTRQIAESSLSREEFERFLQLPVAVIGGETRRTAEELGFIVRWMPDRPEFRDLVSLLAAR